MRHVLQSTAKLAAGSVPEPPITSAARMRYPGDATRENLGDQLIPVLNGIDGTAVRNA